MEQSITLSGIFVIIITAFFTAGGGGFLNFLVLQKLGTIKIKAHEQSEKNFYVLLFSVINFAIFLLITEKQNLNTVSIDQLNFGKVSYPIFLTLLISVFLSVTVFPFFFWLLGVVINLIRTRILKIAKVSNDSPKEMALEKYQFMLVYIFKISDGKFVAKGYLEHWGSEDIEKKEIVLSPPVDFSDIEIQQVRKMFIDYDTEIPNKAPSHFLEIDNDLQYFIFYQ